MREFIKNHTTISIVLLVVVIAAAAIIAGCSIHNKIEHDKEVKAQEEAAAFAQAIAKAQTETINAFNARISGLVDPLQVPDANGENPSLDNNSDIDAMVNAINELHNVANDVASNELLNQEQKDALIQSANGQVERIDGRVQKVNEIREAEAAAAEKAAAEKAAAKKKASSTTTAKKTSAPQEEAEPSGGGGGRTFVMIDIGSQRLYVLNGPVGTDVDACEILFSTGIVSGNAGSADTPTGRYSIKSKQSGVTLRPSDGSTAYVDYWMPFIGNSIGIHDATWRGEEEFGTNQYTVNGSHGCVNLSHGAAATVWDMVSVGTPVIVV